MRLADELTCAELVELVTEYFEGALSSADAARFEEHLALCDGCTTHVDQMRTSLRVTGALREDDVQADVAERLLVAFRGWRRAAR